MTLDPLQLAARVEHASDEQALREGCTFDPDAALRPVRFIERFIRVPEARNPARTQPLELLPWQRIVLMRTFGWLRPDGTRRFRFAWWEIAKKNGKSTLAAAVTIYLLIADGEPDPEVYSCATTREQSAIIFREAAKMVERSPALARVVQVKAHVKRLVFPQAKGFYTPLPNKPAAVDGINAHGMVFDEIHRQVNRHLYDALNYAGSAREQPLQLIITTAGDDRESIGYELHDRAVKIVQGAIIDTETMVFIAAAPDGCDIDDPAAWAAANPSLGVLVDADDLRHDAERAKGSPAAESNFRRLRLNQWVGKVSRFLDIDRWLANTTEVDPESLRGRECWGGLDLSSTTDITAFALVFPRDDGAFDVLAWFWLPADNLAQAEKASGMPMRAWAEQGHLETTPGNYIDYAHVRKRIVELSELYQISEVAFDPAYASQIAAELEDAGITTFCFYQRRTMCNPVLRRMERLVTEQRLNHGHHPILSWMASNVEVDENVDGMIKTVKPKSAAKIDGIDAISFALGNDLKAGAEEVYYDESPLIVIG